MTEHLTREQVQALLEKAGPYVLQSRRGMELWSHAPALARQLIASMDEVEALRHDIERAVQTIAEYDAENERFKSHLSFYKAEWFPILDFLQRNPDVIGVRLGESITEKLLEYLKILAEPEGGV